jgi:hypothetical protein
MDGENLAEDETFGVPPVGAESDGDDGDDGIHSEFLVPKVVVISAGRSEGATASSSSGLLLEEPGEGANRRRRCDPADGSTDHRGTDSDM